LKIYILITILLLAGSAKAATLTVCPSGCDYTNPRSAVDAASPSDAIEIYSGDYDKVVMTKSLTIRGGHLGPDGSIIETGDEPPTIGILYKCHHSLALDIRWLKVIEKRDDCPPGVVSAQGSSPEVAFIPTSSVPANGVLLYSDDFSNMNSGWPTRSADPQIGYCGYKDGRFQIAISEKGKTIQVNPTNIFTNFALESEASLEEGPDESCYGVILRLTEKGNGYYFFITSLGDYSFVKLQNDKWVDIIPWTKSNAIHAGKATNMIKVECNGNKFTFYTNGVKLRECNDNSILSGNIGLFAGAFNEGGVHVSFDNIKVWSV